MRENDPEAIAELEVRSRNLFDEVAAEHGRFEAQVAELDAGAAGHTKVGDTRRSFEMILKRLADSMAHLGRTVRKSSETL